MRKSALVSLRVYVLVRNTSGGRLSLPSFCSLDHIIMVILYLLHRHRPAFLASVDLGDRLDRLKYTVAGATSANDCFWCVPSEVRVE